MKKLTNTPFILIYITILTLFSFYQKALSQSKEAKFLSYEINPTKQELKLYWKDKNGLNYKNFKALQVALGKENKELIFAMNGGMYKKDLSPQGLYIEDGKYIIEADTLAKGYGNFYLQPNGIFYLTNKNKPVICTTKAFSKSNNIKYATQSGPMLLIDGKIHPKFRKGSSNLHIRNGVGVLPNGNILFVLSKKRVNFFDFASYFRQKGCKNALYLDGYVSRAYLPSKDWEEFDGSFGVIIGETRDIK